MDQSKLASLIPIHELEYEAQQQIYNNLNLPFLLKMAIMPDCHTGYTLPIGGVALLDSVISPNYVGYDIGCGMCCIITDVKSKDFFNKEKQKDRTFKKIYQQIPVGGTSRESDFFKYPTFKSASGDKDLDKKVNARWVPQLGTLGGGNHFIEIGEDKDDMLAVTIHSGSRNPGHSIAGYYMKKTKLNDMDLPAGFFHLQSEWGEMYLHDLNLALDYALENRKHMMDIILDLLGFNKRAKEYMFRVMINETHNHAIVLGDNSVLHRKGATESLKDQLGVIPGNMRDGVYVVKGLGNEEYLSSSSHGAGRKGSRRWAKETISMTWFEKTMKGIKAKVEKSTLDESPDAYKDITKVIAAQEGIVINVVNHITPIINIKA